MEPPWTLAGYDVSQAQQWISVTVTGHYDSAHRFAVRNRSQNENAGWYIVTPLVLPDGTAILVNQGWIATSNGDTPSTAMPALPPVPSGTVTVSGWLQPDETTGNTCASRTTRQPARRGDRADHQDGTCRAGARVPARRLDPAHHSSPANTSAAAGTIPGPSYDNTMYIAYMRQWWVFAIIMPVTWLKPPHREAQELKNKALVGQDDDWTEDADEDDEDWDDEDEDWEEDQDEDDELPEPASSPVPAVGSGPRPDPVIAGSRSSKSSNSGVGRIAYRAVHR